MSKENVVAFYEQHVLKNTSLKAQLDGASSRDEFAKIAIAEGTKAGLSFSKDELAAVMAATEQKLGSSLSDDQLAGVVGGAGTPGLQAAPTIQIKQLTTLKSPQTLNPGQIAADTIGCCW